jgi:hypothetical protein
MIEKTAEFLGVVMPFLGAEPGPRTEARGWRSGGPGAGGVWATGQAPPGPPA